MFVIHWHSVFWEWKCSKPIILRFVSSYKLGLPITFCLVAVSPKYEKATVYCGCVDWRHCLTWQEQIAWTFKFKPANSNVSDSFHWRFAMGRFLCFLSSLIQYYLWALRWEEKGLSLLVTLHQPMWCLLAGSSITDLEYSYSRGKAIKMWREALEGTYSRREEKGARLSVW